MPISAVIVAAGNSSRMNGENKIFSIINEQTVLSYSLKAFVQDNLFDQIVLVVSEIDYKKASEHIKSLGYSNVLLVIGGKRRQDSVKNGLKALSKTSYVAIHDAARPCIRKDTISKGIEMVYKHGSAVPVIPINSTIKSLDESGVITDTLDRNKLFEAQTPQFFNYEMILDIHENIVQSCTDDASMAEVSDKKVMTFIGHPTNIKITSQFDLRLAQVILKDKIE